MIEAELTVEEKACKLVYFPRIPLTPSGYGISISFRRMQFLLKPSFAITIYKSQEQTLSFIGIHLQKEDFTNGQPYELYFLQNFLLSFFIWNACDCVFAMGVYELQTQKK